MFVILVIRWLNCYYVLQVFVVLCLLRLLLSFVDLWFAWLCLLFSWFWGGVVCLCLFALWLFVIVCLLIVLLVSYYELYFMLVRTWSISVIEVVVVYYLLFWVVARVYCFVVWFVYLLVLVWLLVCFVMIGWMLVIYCGSVDLVVFTYFGLLYVWVWFIRQHVVLVILIGCYVCCDCDCVWFGWHLFWWLVVGIVCFGLCLNCCVRLVFGDSINSCFVDGSCWYLLFVGLGILFVCLLNYLLLFVLVGIWFGLLCCVMFVLFVLFYFVWLVCVVA